MRSVKMLSRRPLLRILKQYNRILGMEYSTTTTGSLPSTVKRCFFIGLGLGTGIAATVYVARKISRQGNNREIVQALNQVTNELKELRVSMVQHFERTASAFSNEQVLSSKKSFKRVDIKQEVIAETQALPEDESSSDDDFFDLLEDDQNTESLQDRSIINIDELIRKCDDLSENPSASDNEKEITILEDMLTRSPENVEVLWRCARAYKVKAERYAGNFEAKKEAVFKGLRYIEKAVSREIGENNERVHRWCAIILGTAIELAPIKDQIPYSHRFKKHITKAIELNPKESTNYYLMGRWCFGIAHMSWWQRQAAIAFLGEPPTSSIEEALYYFEQSEKLVPGSVKPNLLYIAKCHHALGDTEKAKEWLGKALELPVKDLEDRKAQEEATVILQSL